MSAFTADDVQAAATAGFKLGWLAACKRAADELAAILADAKQHGHGEDEAVMPVAMMAKMIAWVAQRAPEEEKQVIEP